MLRSQDGVESVEEPYVNLKQGVIKIKTKKDKAVDLAKLVLVLEKEAGFEPVTAVTLELRGRLARREGKLFFEVSESGQSFRVEKVAGAGRPPENQLLEATATLAKPQSGDRIVLQQWKAATPTTGNTGPGPAVPASLASAELEVRGMT